MEEVSRLVVLITAAGLLGLKPLVTQNNVGKGSRQNRSVTSGKGLALKAEQMDLVNEEMDGSLIISDWATDWE